ncbi:hypothetical protein ACI6Q2_08860 [Chitinophagaceae bacterium LWZ2-11]
MISNYKNIASIKTSSSLFENKVEFKNKIAAAFLPYKIEIVNKQITESLMKFTFHNFYHPYSELLLETMNKYGFKAIFDKGILDKSDKDVNEDGSTFKDRYNPNSLLVKKPYPVEEFTFKIGEPYAQDNWMTFYHSITLIAETLLVNNKNDEAIQWIENCLYNPKAIELIPDPKKRGDNAKYWKLPVFKDELTKSTAKFFDNISDSDLQKIITDLQANPFNPFLVAYNRPQEFMMYVVHLYVKAHIAQGDIHFRMAYNGGGMDYLNLALEYYKIAKNQLGERIQNIPNVLKKKPESYQSLKEKGYKDRINKEIGVNAVGNALVQFENIFPFCSQNTIESGDTSNGSLLGGGYTFYFSVPPDKATNELQDLIDDRLFKLRNCRDIDGIVRKIDLFGTPINPAQLLAALAKGLSFGEILGSMFSPPPLYKVSFSIQKAKEINSELKALGSAIVSAIEKGNAEELGLLQAKHETDGLNRMLSIKERQVYQAQLEKQVLLKSRETTINKIDYYQSLLGTTGEPIPGYKEIPPEITSDSVLPEDTIITPTIVDVDVTLVDSNETGIKVIPKEDQEISYMQSASKQRSIAIDSEKTAAIMSAIPSLSVDAKPFGIGIGLGTVFTLPFTLEAKSSQSKAEVFSLDANLSSKYGSYIRREQEWAFQTNLAKREIIQIDKNLAVSDIKIQSAGLELSNLKTQITEAQEKQDFMVDKESNYLAYYQIADKLKSVHKNFYNLALYYARSAEQAYQFEKPDKVIDFISYNYDNSIVGCATGADDLSNSINQMEKAYLSDTLRPLEMKVNIQLSRLNPIALLQLRKEGVATFEIPEWFLLLKNRGIYNAKWISVNFTFPMITGPYINMNAMITMTKNFIRPKAIGGDNFEMQSDSDDRFVQRVLPFNKVLITNGNNDAGYNLDASATGNELYQHQYRPFEQAGAICEFEIDLNSKTENFDFSELNWDTLSDVIISGVISVDIDKGKYKDDAEKYLSGLYKNIDNKDLSLFIDIKHDLPNELFKFKNDINAQNLIFNIDKSKFPYITQNKKITITGIDIITLDSLQSNQINIEGINQSEINSSKEAPIGQYQINSIKSTQNGSNGNLGIVIDNNSREIGLQLTKENAGDTFIVLKYILEKRP